MDGSNKRPREPEEVRCRYLRFTNLPHGCTAGELTALLEALGKVEDCRVARASDGGMLALVEMSCTREASGAKRKLNDMPLRGSSLTVNFDASRAEAPTTTGVAGGIGGGDAKPAEPAAGARAPMQMRAVAEVAPFGSKLPPFYVPERMVNDVYENRVIKMRSVLWTAREDDIRQFYRGIVIDRDAIEMGRDHAGRFSGMVYVRLRSTQDASAALRRGADTLCGRSVILARVDLTTPGIFRPVGHDEPPRSMPPRDATPKQQLVEPRPWPTSAPRPAPAPAPAPTPSGHVGLHLTVGPADKGQAPSLQRALAAAPVGESLAAVRHFLGHDPRLPLSTRNAAQFLDALRSRLVDAPAQPSVSPKLSRHLFRSPFEVAGVHRYSMPEVEHVFGTKSSDSVFWSIFSTFHTLLPHEVEEAAPDESIADFVGQGARTRD